MKGLIEASVNVHLMVLLTSMQFQQYVIFKYLFMRSCFCGHFFVSAGPKGVINDWRRFKLDSVDQTVPQSKRELLRQMSSPREDDKERLNRKVDRNTHRTSHIGKRTIDRFYGSWEEDNRLDHNLTDMCQQNKKICTNRRRESKSQAGASVHRQINRHLQKTGTIKQKHT